MATLPVDQGWAAAPFDRVEAVAAVVAVGHEVAAGIAAAADVGDHHSVAPGSEVAAVAPGLPCRGVISNRACG